MISKFLFLLLVSVFLVILWFFIRSLIIMSREHIGWTIAGFFVPPVVQIIFFFTQRGALDDKYSSEFENYFMSIGAFFVLFFMFAVMVVSESGMV